MTIPNESIPAALAEELAAFHRGQDAAMSQWAEGYGPIRHSAVTQLQLRGMADLLAARDLRGDGVPFLHLLHAADRVASAAMWLVVHQTYSKNVYIDGRSLSQEDFKDDPEGHTGGSLNMVPAYVGYMALNAATGCTRSWLMGQGHCVSAIDSVNLLLGNMTPAHAERYSWTNEGLTRYVRDFYSHRLNAKGEPDSPLGSHVNVHTAGGMLEGGYLGFAELQYVHMPLPGERLVVFLSDGAFEEQRGSDWAPRWWRAEDCGMVLPVMINNGRRIDQRTTMSMQGGASWFAEYLRLNGFEPIVFDGRDPACYLRTLFEQEQRLEAAAVALEQGEQSYPVRLPYGIAVAPKGAGFYGEGTNLAHNLPLRANPKKDPEAAHNFNESARRLWVSPEELNAAVACFNQHDRSRRPRERDHPLANREIPPLKMPAPEWKPVPDDRSSPADWKKSAPMGAIDREFLSIVQANPHLRPRVGNPDEMKSNRMLETLDALRFRVTAPEPGLPESIGGAVITALNEEAVASAALANKGGINIIVTYEAFGAKMHGAVRQEITFANQRKQSGRAPGWLSVPVVLTSHTWENAKNESSHQDPIMTEAMLGEPSDISRVLFPADYNTAARTIRETYNTKGQIWTLVVPKGSVADLFTPDEAASLMRDGAASLTWAGYRPSAAKVILTAVGAYQLGQITEASARLASREIEHQVVYMLEPGRFRHPRSRGEQAHAASADVRRALFPDHIPLRVFLTHTRPEPLIGALHPLNTGSHTIGLGYLNSGGTLDLEGMLFVNRSTWAHCVYEAARLLDLRLSHCLTREEVDALEGRVSPDGIIIHRSAAQAGMSGG
jgi:phosphoketolase